MMTLGCIRETLGCGYRVGALKLLIGESKITVFSSPNHSGKGSLMTRGKEHGLKFTFIRTVSTGCETSKCHLSIEVLFFIHVFS